MNKRPLADRLNISRNAACTYRSFRRSVRKNSHDCLMQNTQACAQQGSFSPSLHQKAEESRIFYLIASHFCKPGQDMAGIEACQMMREYACRGSTIAWRSVFYMGVDVRDM